MAIQSFKDKRLKSIFNQLSPARFPPTLIRVTHRKLIMLNNAVEINDLKVPPNNHLEALKHDRRGQHSIRVNDQYRLCFVWTSSGPENVEFTDYHS